MSKKIEVNHTMKIDGVSKQAISVEYIPGSFVGQVRVNWLDGTANTWLMADAPSWVRLTLLK
jgi:hypothetical protein